MNIFKFAAFLLLSNFLSAQDLIITKNDTISAVEGSIHVALSGKKLMYINAKTSEKTKVKIKDVISATFKDRRFVTYQIKNKVRGGFLLTENKDAKLIVLSSKRSVNKGGFDVPYMRYELSIVRNSDTKQLVFTDVNNKRNIAFRAEATQLIQGNFADCETIITRLKSFESDKKDIENPAITGLLENPYFTACN